MRAGQPTHVATGEHRDVTLLASGSATGAGRVYISNGVGSRLIRDYTAETVNLELLDTEATGLDVSSTEDVVFGPGDVAQFAILDPTDGTVGDPVTVIVQQFS